MTSRSGQSSTCPDGALDQLYRTEWGRLVSLLVSRTRRLDLAEDAVSDAFAAAASRWRADGVPENPVGWLYTTAYRRVLGRIRAEAVAGRKAPLLAVRPEFDPNFDSGDELAGDRLYLIMLCCHPALPEPSRSALALRLVIGTPTDQIARLFLVPTPTMAARITRAKKKIVLAGIPLGSPVEDELRDRLDEVCRTIYLAFTAGYTPGSGPDLLRADLAGEAVRLARVLAELAPQAPQVRSLLALLLLQHSRRDARVRDGRLVRLPDQDRALWRHDEIDAGLQLLAGLEPTEGYAEELRLQAKIAAVHARSRSAVDTDWAVVATLYAQLEALTDSAVVRLNRAVALAESEGPRAGLVFLEGLDQLLSHSHRLGAIRGDLYERLGDIDRARTNYLEAIGRCTNEAEQAHLRARLDGLRS